MPGRALLNHTCLCGDYEDALKTRVGFSLLFGYTFSMNNIDLKKLNHDIERFVEDRDWDQFHSLKNLTMALSVECSELLEIFQWLSEKQSNEVKNNPEILSKVQDEVADIFFYLMRIISKTEIDIETVVHSKMLKNAEKYPIERSRGIAKKYNEL